MAQGKISHPLFETKRATSSGWWFIIINRLFSFSLFAGIFSIWLYRFSHLFHILHGSGEEEEDDKSWVVVVWVGLLGTELFFGLYWVLTQALRWNPVFRKTFKQRLSQRYEDRLPRVDVFVCTADPEKEPPMMVMNTVLSVMAYDYPSEKLSVYLSDDAASEITFYALLEASSFAKKWLPFCKRFNVEPRSPSAYFNASSLPTSSNDDSVWTKELADIKDLYEDMERRIEDAANSGQVHREVRSEHEGFSQWDSYYSSQRDHDTILQILLHRKDVHNSKDADGSLMPTLVYLAREKRPQYHHHFKAGAMNSLIRVSSKISKGKIILNVDCDMSSNSSGSVRDALCFFMDEEKGHEIAFVQFPQNFVGVTKNDLYGNSMRVFCELEAPGTDGFGGPLYIGTGCFHRRDVLCGGKFSDQHNNTINDWDDDDDDLLITQESLRKQEQESKPLASCTYEHNTAWGSQMGLLYGCAVEDVLTGLSIHSKGWKSVYYNPERKAFLGAPLTTLGQALVQQKRWAEGDFQILVSKYSPPWHAYGKLSVGLQMVYCNYCFWAPKSLPTLYYCLVPSLCLLKGIPVFPKISSPWFMPFAYVILAGTSYSLLEFLSFGGTVQGWWNEQRMWLYKRTSSFFFAFMESILKLLGFPLSSGFAITAKVAEQDASQLYEKEIMEFGASSPMFILLATLAVLNLFCFVGVSIEVLISEGGFFIRVLEKMMLQIMLCGVLVLINVPIYEGLFFRKDKGRLPTSVAIKSTLFALSACVLFKALN